MKINEVTYKWNGTLSTRKATNSILLHHAAASGLTAQEIHRIHQNNKWTGIGYHFYIRKDGSVYRGRPINAVGSHCLGRNSDSIGICFEGNYETEKTMPIAQLNAGKELIAYLKGIYPSAKVRKHSDYYATACPGRYFPFDEIKNGVVNVECDKVKSAAEAIAVLVQKGIIQEPDKWYNGTWKDEDFKCLIMKFADYVKQ